jgi:hypothetical protein
MKQYKVTSADINQSSPDDAYLAPDDPIHELKALAGLGGLGGMARLHEYRAQQTSYGETFGEAGMEKSKIMREQNIRPGDPEWFSLWFSLPYFKKNDDMPTLRSRKK